MKKYKIHSLKRVTGPARPQRTPVEMDSVKWSSRQDRDRGTRVLADARICWDNMERFRADRERNLRYNYGDQWGDSVTVDCREMTEEEYIKTQGSVPLKNNLIRRLVRNVLGVYRSQSSEPTCTARDRDEQKLGETMSTILQCNMQLNRMKEVNARSFEEFLISGLVIHRKTFGWRHDKLDCWTDYVNPNNFFIDTNMKDFRGWDCSLVGELHDIRFNVLCNKFAKTPDDRERLKRLYHVNDGGLVLRQTYEDFAYSDRRLLSFLFPADRSLCRVIEVWRKESKPRYRCHDYNDGDVFKVDLEDYGTLVKAVNDDRIARGTAAGMAKEDIPLIEATWFMDDYWYYYYLTPWGDILEEGETPYAHKSHPYVWKAYPFINGEIHSFVADVIDQQRYVNRLITLYDWIMRASAKGVLMVPDDCVGTNHSPEDFADEWSRFNGVIFYTPSKSGAAPQQVANNSTNIGINELLQLELKFFEDISGVHGALQGRQAGSNVSGTLYNQQTQNATMSLLDMLDGFSQFVIDGAIKDVKNMQQYYDNRRVFNIAGKAGAQIEYDPAKISDVEFDLSVTESTETPAYRQMANEFLMQIWQAGQISLQQLLENGDFPFADNLLQSLQSQREQLQQGETPQGLSPEVQRQAEQGANMQAVNQAYQALQPGK